VAELVDAKWVHTIPIAARYMAAGEYRFESCPDYKAKGPHLPAIGV